MLFSPDFCQRQAADLLFSAPLTDLATSRNWRRRRRRPWGGKTSPQAIAAVAHVYLGFTATHPSLYKAMFQLPIEARFEQDDAETELRSAFNALAATLGNDDDGTATELLWSALHGISLPDAPRAPAQPDSRTRGPASPTDPKAWFAVPGSSRAAISPLTSRFLPR